MGAHRDGRQRLATERRRRGRGRGGRDARPGESAGPITARIVATATSGVAPKDVFIAPVSAIEQVLAKARLTVADIDLVELNEAFAAQLLGLPAAAGDRSGKDSTSTAARSRLGHPIGASGARVLVTLLHALARA